MRTSRHVLLGPLLVVCLVLSACSSAANDAADARQVDVAAADVGANARQSVLDRYVAGVEASGSALTPELIGMTVEQATARAAEDGFDVRVVPFDPTSPVTAQSPAYGQPAPLDRVIEIRQGSLAGESEEPQEGSDVDPTAVAAVEPEAGQESEQDDPVSGTEVAEEPAAPETTQVAEQPASAVAATTPIEPAYVLPPHTEGRLRINPRRLPALPLGTQLSGNASWYGPGFHGNQTACGGIYDQNGPTIAARELRCGTVVRITGPSGTTVEATVTDWGPAEWTGRRFDLSAAVFNAIAPLGAGVIPVTVVTANVPG